MRFVVLNGPNLNLLGTREPDVYGTTTLDELDGLCRGWGADVGVDIDTFQSNHEGALVDRIQAAADADGLIINAAAYSHTSYAIADAVQAVGVPVVEVHISNVMEREPFRRHLVLEGIAARTIYGRGIEGYRWAIQHLAHRLTVPFTTIPYGHDDDRVGELRLPDGPGPHPAAVLLHGGFWKPQWTRDLMDPIAVDLHSRGHAVWNIEYRRVGSGGGYPETLFDVAAAMDHLAQLAPEHNLDLSRVTVFGHSAGGHLALWAASRSRLAPGEPGADPLITPTRVVGLSAVTDLVAAARAELGDGAVQGFMGGAPGDAWRVASPIELLPIGVPTVLIHGDDDEIVPVAQSVAYAGAASNGGTAELVRFPGGHYEPIDPSSEVWHKVVAQL